MKALLPVSLRLLSLASFLLASVSASGQTSTVRLLVDKNLTPNRPFGSPIPLFAAITSSRPAAAGFTQIADYPSRTLYNGPAAAAASLISSLSAEGYRARIATDLENVSFHDHRINPDTGVATPPFPAYTYQPTGTDGLYLMVLRGYPAAQWLQDLRGRNVRLIEALPPAAYLVRGARSTLATLKSQASYVRGVFLLTPTMKPSLASPTSPSPFRRVLVQGVEETAQDALKPYLDSVSQTPTILGAKLANGRASYVASLADLDINNLALFENVYSIAQIPEARPSAERQGKLTIAPITDGPLTLPAPLFINESYWEGFLLPAGLSDLNNTKIAILDTGFDDGTNTHPDFQFFSTPSVTDLLTEFGPPDTPADSFSGHGTMTASVITAFRFWGDQRADAENYRYSFGLAPGVKLISDKVFSCSFPTPPGFLTPALNHIFDPPLSLSPNVVNLSLNNVNPGSCGYTADSEVVDRRSRQRQALFTVSAGNTPDYCQQAMCDPPTCAFVRGPATAKNAIAVGATENFTFPYTDPPVPPFRLCDWNRQPSVRDARHIPSFSASRDTSTTPNSMVKPDLVAPGTRVTGPVTRATRCRLLFCNAEVQGFPDVTYGMSLGTSFAAPAVAGAAAVVRKWYSNLTTILNPSPALTKAILINAARDVGGAPSSPPCPAAAVRNEGFGQDACVGHIPDRYQGWGMLNLTRLLGPASNYFFSDQNQHPILTPTVTSWETLLTVNDGARPIRITMVYSDAAGNMTITPYKVKNDLQVGAFQSACFPCWVGNNFNPVTGLSVPNSFTNDDLNNVEEIIIPAGSYLSGSALTVFVQVVSLIEDAISGGPDPQQDFAIFVENAR